MIQINALVKSYKQITLQYPAINITKRITLLVGSNGSGKSTLFKALLGLIQYDGTIKTDETFAFMPERPSFPKDCSVETFLRMLCNKPYETALSDFSLTAKRNHLIQHLSKGMQGKVNFIQAYCQEATTLLLDEPTEGLDVASLAQLKNYITTTTRNVIISTHSPEYFTDIAMDVIDLD